MCPGMWERRGLMAIRVFHMERVLSRLLRGLSAQTRVSCALLRAFSEGLELCSGQGLEGDP